MSKSKPLPPLLKWCLGLLVAGLIFYILSSSLTQPGVQDLKGGFDQVAFYRNENNTGPIVRIYAVTVADTVWEEMKKYGQLMPHSKYGTTKVYFFLKNGHPVPDEVFPGERNFAQKYDKTCLAKYEMNSMGRRSFIKY